EDQDRDLEHAPASVDIADLAEERHRDGRAEQVRREDPRDVIQAAEVADDGRQRRRDDRGVERAEKEADEQGSEYEPQAVTLCHCPKGSGPRGTRGPRPDRRGPSGGYYTLRLSSSPLLSANCSMCSPYISRMRRCRFAIGVFSGYCRNRFPFRPKF